MQPKKKRIEKPTSREKQKMCKMIKTAQSCSERNVIKVVYFH